MDGNFELGFKYQNVSDMSFDGMCVYLVYFDRILVDFV